MQNLTERTLQSISLLEADPEIRNMLKLVDQHFELWTERLFPLLQSKRIACYPYVVKLLHESGHTVATVELVRKYISVIRARRGIPAKPFKAPVGVTPTVTFTRPAREVRADPGVRVQAAPVAQAVVEAVPGVVPVEVTDWHAEYKRLDSEERSSPWSGADQWMWDWLTEKARVRGLHLFRNAPDVEEMLTMTQKSCYTHLLTKYSRFHK